MSASDIDYIEPWYRCPVCNWPATQFEDGEIQCDNRNCEDLPRPSTAYGKYSETDFRRHAVDTLTTCPDCNAELVPVAESCGTGVFAPDGYEQTEWCEGLWCLRCREFIER